MPPGVGLPHAQQPAKGEGHQPEALALYRRALSVQLEHLARTRKRPSVRPAIRALELKGVELE